MFLPVTAWEAEQATLAMTLEDETWAAVEGAFVRIRLARTAIRLNAEEADDPHDRTGIPLRVGSVELFQRVADEADQARQQLIDA